MTTCHNTLDLPKAAKFLGINKETARRRAATGELPGAKVGKAWRFLEEDLVTYLRSLYPNQASQGVINHRSKTLWHSTKEMASGGSIFSTEVNEYVKALRLQSR